ncbi:hypothetical protein V1264_001471 [Littorina saxatilis]|uniref:Uncharacterized protein n=1 Tax=Littorina saxatilis TaxID=31220 RepID=A0AAN9GNV2_9CAEN
MMINSHMFLSFIKQPGASPASEESIADHTSLDSDYKPDLDPDSEGSEVEARSSVFDPLESWEPKENRFKKVTPGASPASEESIADHTSLDSDYVPDSEGSEVEARSLVFDPLGSWEPKEADIEAEREGPPTKEQLRRAFEKVTVAGDPTIDGKRNYQKPDYCLFCKGKYTSKISSHLLSVHCEEARVQAVTALPCGSKERKRVLGLLQNEGNHLHNTEVLRCGKGEITVSRRPSDRESAKPENYLPCINCINFG